MKGKSYILLRQLQEEYSKKGYSTEKNKVIPYRKSFLVIDLLATIKNKSIAILLDDCSEQKLSFLNKNFSEVRCVPILEKSEDGYLKHNLCGNVWKPKVNNPKRCPKCKGRLL